MAYFDLLRQALMGDITKAGRVGRAQARAGYNQVYGQGLTQSGALATGTEAIARQEGAEMSGVNAYVGALEEERRREDRLLEEQRKANRLQTILGIGEMAVPMVAPLVKKGIGALTGGGGGAAAAPAAQLGTGMPQVNLAGIREAGGNVAGNMMGAQTNPALSPLAMQLMRMRRRGRFNPFDPAQGNSYGYNMRF